MIQDSAMVRTAGLLFVRKPALERDIRKKVTAALISLKLNEAREISAAGAGSFFQETIAQLNGPALLKLAKKLDPHLPGRDAMPEAWLQAHVKKLIAAEAEPIKAIKKPRPPKAASSSSRRTKPEKVKTVVNG
ncbi:MAG: hypothetical protein ACLPWS_19600 [Rhodomicrobium sp.]